MASKGDIQATRSTAAAGPTAIVAQPIRLKGIIIASDGVGAGVLELTTTSNSGTTLFIGDVPNGDVINLSFPEDGILFPKGIFCKTKTNIAAYTLLTDKYSRLGIQGVSGNQLRMARRSLNIMLQEWGNRGIHYWEIADTNIDLVEGQAEYDFFRASSDGTSATTTPTNGIYGMSDILEAQLRQNYNTTNQSDSPMVKVDRSTYAGFSNKLSEGTPNQYWVERFIDKVRVHIYPTPDSTNASNYMHMYYINRIQDVGDYTNATDIPFRFVACMVAGLAYYLSMKINPQLMQPMKLVYEDEFQRALQEDGSASSTYITPKVYYPGI
jgi:hypothetical protein